MLEFHHACQLSQHESSSFGLGTLGKKRNELGTLDLLFYFVIVIEPLQIAGCCYKPLQQQSEENDFSDVDLSKMLLESP